MTRTRLLGMCVIRGLTYTAYIVRTRIAWLFCWKRRFPVDASAEPEKLQFATVLPGNTCPNHQHSIRVSPF